MRVAVEDPYDLTRLDAIKAMNLAPRYEFLVGLRDDILACVRASYGETGPGGRRRPTSAGSSTTSAPARRTSSRARPRRSSSPRSTRRTAAIVKLCNQIIIDAYNRGASDIHVEPYGKTLAHHRPPAHRRRLPEVPRGAGPPPQRPRPAPQDHGQARHRREAQAPGRQDPLPGPDGDDRAARRHHPHLGRQRGRGHAHPGRLQAPAPREDGLLGAQPPRVQGDPRRSPTASASWWAPPAPARPPPCTPRSASSTPWTSRSGPRRTRSRSPRPGLRQVQVHPKIDFTFAAAMRSFLRADPDVIMVGEMRDHETAAIGDRGLAHRPPGLLHPAHQLGPGDDHPPPRHGHRPVQLRRRPARDHGPAPGAHAVRRLQGGVHALARRSSPSWCSEYGAEHWDKRRRRLLAVAAAPPRRRAARSAAAPATRAAWASTSSWWPRTRSSA